MVLIFQVGFGYARSLVSLGLEGCASRIEAIVHADVKSSVSWQAHSWDIVSSKLSMADFVKNLESSFTVKNTPDSIL